MEDLEATLLAEMWATKRSGQAIRPRPRRRDSEEHPCSGEDFRP